MRFLGIKVIHVEYNQKYIIKLYKCRLKFSFVIRQKSVLLFHKNKTLGTSGQTWRTSGGG